MSRRYLHRSVTQLQAFDKRILDFVRCPLSACRLEYEESASSSSSSLSAAANSDVSAFLVAHATIDTDGASPRRIRIAYPVRRDGVPLLRSSDAALSDER